MQNWSLFSSKWCQRVVVETSPAVKNWVIPPTLMAALTPAVTCKSLIVLKFNSNSNFSPIELLLFTWSSSVKWN